MNNYKMPENSEMDQLREAFSRNAWFQELTSDLRSENISGEVSLSRLYAYVTSYTSADEVLEKKINDNQNLRLAYLDMIKRTAIYHLPQAMAASSEEFPIRHGKDFTIRMEASRAEEDQVYVIIEAAETVFEFPKIMYLITEDKVCQKCELPEPRNNIIQLIYDHKSDVIAFLKNPNTEVKLN